MRVVVLGSKPFAPCVSGGLYYLANGASLAGTHLPEGRRIHVLDGASLRTDYREGKASAETIDTVRRALGSGEMNETVVLDSDLHQECFLSDPLTVLRPYGYRSEEVSYLTRPEVFSLIDSVVGKSPPFGYRYIFNAGFKCGFYYLRSIIRNWTGRVLLGRDAPFIEKFRPSAGVISLIFAISRHGRSAEYVISGVGLDVSTKYNYGHGVFTSLKRVRGHLFGDWYVLRRIARRYNVVTPDLDLSRKSGIPYLSDPGVFVLP